MKEIIFRAKSIKYPNSGFIFWPIKQNPPIDIIDDTIGQYSELRDKNGKEIYEGDILKIKSRDKGFNIHNRGETLWGDWYEFVGEVYTKPMMWLFKPIGKSGWQGHLVTINANVKEAGGEIEVIGNIHDNSELCHD